MYRQESSIRSIAGGVGTPGGEGVEYSPTSNDVGDGAGERRVEHGAPLLDACGVDPGLELRNVRLRGAATRASRLSFGARGFLARAGDEALFAQRALPLRLAFGVGGLGAGFSHALSRRRHLRQRQRALRLLIVVPQFHQELALLHAVAFFYRQHFDAAAHDRRQLGALAGIDRAGAGVGDARFDDSAIDLPDRHRDWLGAANPPEGGGEGGDDGDGDE